MNRRQKDLIERIQGLTREFFENRDPSNFVPGESPVRLIEPSYSWPEVSEAIESLLSVRITLNQWEGTKVSRFERAWADYIGSDHGVMVNSGSSANLLAFFALANPLTPRRIEVGDEVITSALTWHTAYSPILSVGAVPVLVDVDPSNFCMDPNDVEAMITPRTRAILAVHLLGRSCPMDAILDIADRHNLYVIEDTCEGPGSECLDQNGDVRRCGSLGDFGTFSFYFSHHITTLEGGMLTTSNEELAELLRIMRSQGVIRNTVHRDRLERQFASDPDFSDLDPGFLFANIGFNVRPTEINGGFGLEQIKGIEEIHSARQRNVDYWTERLRRHEKYLTILEPSPLRTAWFGFPVIVRPEAPFARKDLVSFLNERKIETRPVMAGNITRQPGARLFPHRSAPLPNTDLIHERGLFWGVHQAIGDAERTFVADCVDEFIAQLP